MAEVSLKDIPDKGADLEHYVAALFQSAGYFVEKNITERAPGDVLELDVVASDYSMAQPTQPLLVEVKGGDWGWKVIFQLLGQSTYLGIGNAALFVKQPPDCCLDVMRSKFSPHNLEIVHIDDFSQSGDLFERHGFGGLRSDLSIWRYSYWIERELVAIINKNRPRPPTGSRGALHAYHRLVNDGSFFESDPIEQVHSLCQAYREHPSLTGDLADELDRDAAPADESDRASSLAGALYEGTEPLLQASMYVEHRARLSLLKFAVDCLLGEDESDDSQHAQFSRLFRLARLPVSFNEGLAWLRRQPTFWRYPVFWQQFMWGYGGFYLEHRSGEEFEWMAEFSGVPACEIPTALEAYDHLFPLPNGRWLNTSGASDLMLVKMAPWPFQGLGAALRLAQYEPEDGFRSLGGKWYTASDLAQRFQNSRALLNGDRPNDAS